jgi:hypothetical protein
VQGHIPASVTEVSCSLTGAGRARKIALPVVSVKVTSRGSNSTIVTCALLDSGSTNTFCSEELKNLLGVKGMREMISLTTLETDDKIDQAEVVELQVSALNDQNVVTLSHVYTRKHLPLSLHNVATIDDVSKWSHLNNIQLPDLSGQKIMMLIGQDAPDALTYLDIRRGREGEPYAVKTPFG